LTKEKYDLENFSDKQAEGLMVRALEVEPQKRFMAVDLNPSLDPKTEIIRNSVIIAEKRGMKFLNVLK